MNKKTPLEMEQSVKNRKLSSMIIYDKSGKPHHFKAGETTEEDHKEMQRLIKEVYDFHCSLK